MHYEPLPGAGVIGMPTTATQRRDTAPVDTFERIEEYRAVLEEHGRLSARRQNLNDVFVAINTISLTALGFLLFQSRLDSWWIVGTVGSISLAITPINVIWRTAIERYKSEIKVHVEYLSSIEREFRRRREANEGEAQEGELPIGFYLYNSSRRRAHSGKSRLEKRLATYFIIIYPVITLVLAALTYLISKGMLPPATL